MKSKLFESIFIVCVLFTSVTYAMETMIILPVHGQNIVFTRYLTTKATGLFYAAQSVRKTSDGYYEILSLVEYNRPNENGVQRVVVEQYLAEEYYLVSRLIGYSETNKVVYDKFVESLKWNYISPQDVASVLLYLSKETLHEI